MNRIDGDYEDGTFRKACDRAISVRNQACVLIIDEINRANIEAVLGEAREAIRRRNMVFSTKKTNKPLICPENLIILATMNDFDKTLTPLERRFIERCYFHEIKIDSIKN